MDRHTFLSLLSLLVLLFSACDSSTTGTLAPTVSQVVRTVAPTAAPSTPTATSPARRDTPVPMPTTEPLDTGWAPADTGVEVRSLDVPLQQGTERVTIARVYPETVRLSIAYRAGDPQYLSAWAIQAQAVVAVNGGYFTSDLQATGLVVSGGERHGTSYGEFAGMLYAGADGVPRLRWMQTQPYDPDELLSEAVQCFPVLVKPGGTMGFPADADDGRIARRTVVAQDRAGRILFLIAPRGFFGLHALATWLVESDLEVDIAINLDGGPSSGLWVPDEVAIDSLLPVPVAVFLLVR